MHDFFICTNGDVEVYFFLPIGNIKEQAAREIWYGPKAQEIRKQTVACERLCLSTCLSTCLSQKTLVDKVKMGLQLAKRRPRPREGEALPPRRQRSAPA
jgi:Iron-sulfur cluster-binding domain